MASQTKKGRSRGPVWQYFDEIDGENTAKCIIRDKNDKECEHLVKGKSTGNMKDHLKRRHVDEHKSVLELEKTNAQEQENKSKKKKPNSDLSKQPSLSDYGLTKYYSQHHWKQKSFESEAAWFFGSTTIGKRVIESNEFRKMIAVIDPQIRPISVTKLTKLQKIHSGNMKHKLIEDLTETKSIHIMGDIWSKRGLTQSYLALCGAFFSRLSHKRQVVLLSLELFPNPHNAERILQALESTLLKWNIPMTKLGKLISDNGSNFEKCFTKCVQDLLERTNLENNGDVAQQRSNPDIISAASSNTRDIEPIDDDQDLDTDSDEDEIELPTRRANYLSNVSLDEFGLEFESDEQIETQEAEAMSACNKVHIRRVRCFAHTLDLVLKEFEVDPNFKALMELVNDRISSFWHSTVAKSKIKQLGGRGLVKIAKTRWIYRRFFIKSLVDLENVINQVCDEQKLNRIQPSEWSQLKIYLEMLEPFAYACGVNVKDSAPTISRVISTLIMVKTRLSNLGKSHVTVQPLCNCLIRKIDDKFKYVFDKNFPSFDPFFCAATFLDPGVCWVLSKEQLDVAQEHLSTYFSESNNSNLAVETSAIASSQQNIPAICSEMGELEQIYVQRRQEQLRAMRSHIDPQSTPQWKRELDVYVSNFYDRTTNCKIADPIEFWNARFSEYPKLADIAVDILSCPASSAMAECIFSKAGIATSGRRMNLSGENLELEVMFQTNFAYR